MSMLECAEPGEALWSVHCQTCCFAKLKGIHAIACVVFSLCARDFDLYEHCCLLLAFPRMQLLNDGHSDGTELPVVDITTACAMASSIVEDGCML